MKPMPKFMHPPNRVFRRAFFSVACTVRRRWLPRKKKQNTHTKSISKDFFFGELSLFKGLNIGLKR